MTTLTYEDVFNIMCDHLGDHDYDRLFSADGLSRVRKIMPPFLAGRRFPEIYLEFPLAGSPFLDATVLYNMLSGEEMITSPLAQGCERMLRCFADLQEDHPVICCGFEIDTDSPYAAAAVHFEPYEHTECVMPFCQSIGMNQYGELYLKMADRMRNTWPLSFFGMFRGRSDAPLRVCGYLSTNNSRGGRRVKDTVASALETAGFSAYDDMMLEDIRTVLDAASSGRDYQMDVYPDGTTGDTFSLDIALSGNDDMVMSLLKEWHIADGRLDMTGDLRSSFAIPVVDGDDITAFIMIIKPAWVKFRWKDRLLQNAKCYCRMQMIEKGLNDV
ncbi:MAG: hypothetical protein IKQ40_07235 [Lachnospiraceae bacterium]|nr:hypothetical protein [Lachnospiraceae bacterium]